MCVEIYIKNEAKADDFGKLRVREHGFQMMGMGIMGLRFGMEFWGPEFLI